MVIKCFAISLFTYFTFEILVNLSIQFHHSSLKVHTLLDKLWMILFVPPSMHRIHHSIKKEEYNSNYGVIFSLWDKLIGTFLTGKDETKIEIGLNYCRDFKKLGFYHLLVMPFKIS
ncbi:MAG: sterol desaturase family protein [Candidatus Schekmanbacteria bacterium]|nr:MAG: sterol desaturase family protein [Candidatus Schekmanbacteria bacterium]